MKILNKRKLHLPVIMISFFLFIWSLNITQSQNAPFLVSEVVSTESSGDSLNPAVAIDGNNDLHVVWYDKSDYLSSGSDDDVFYKFWNSTTTLWGPTEVVSTESTATSRAPAVEIDESNNVHVVWQDQTDYLSAGTDIDVFYKFRNTTTSSWSVSQVVSTESTSTSINPTLSIDLYNNVHVAWDDFTAYSGSGGDPDIFYKHLNASTSNWITTEVVSTESTGLADSPSLAIDSMNNVHISWEDGTDYLGSGFDPDIFYKYRNITTANWSPAEVISTESTDSSYNPSMGFDNGNNVHVAWEDFTNYLGSGTDFDILYKYLNTTSGIWTVTSVLSTLSTQDSLNPSLTIDINNNVHVAWEDQTDYQGSGVDSDIFYQYLNSTSGAWSATELVSTESGADSFHPRIKVDSGKTFHVVWDDATNYLGSGSDSDIFYKSGQRGIVVTTTETRTTTDTQTVTATAITTETSTQTNFVTDVSTSVTTESGGTETVTNTDTQTSVFTQPGTTLTTTQTTETPIIPIAVISGFITFSLIVRRKK